MCLVTPARVIAIDGFDAVVELDGVHRRATLLLEPDVSPGDWVIVGSGAVLRRVEPGEALDIATTLRGARSRAAAATKTGGPP